MNNLNETVGLQVINTSPLPYMTGVNIYDHIQVIFSEDLNAGTVSGNIRVYKDIHHAYSRNGELEDLSKFTPIQTRSSYKDKVVTLAPLKPLETGFRYIIYIPELSVKSISGKQMLQPYNSVFSTEEVVSASPVILLGPSFGYVSTLSPLLSWTDSGESYHLQVSKLQNFDTLLIDERVSESEFQLNNLPEGRYFWRVKEINGYWSDNGQFFIESYQHMPVSHEDTMEMDAALPWDNDIEILEVFPEDGFSNVGLNLKSMYIKFKGLVSKDDINFGFSFVEGELRNLDDEMDGLSPHGPVDGQWTIVHDKSDDVSYLIFTMDKL